MHIGACMIRPSTIIFIFTFWISSANLYYVFGAGSHNSCRWVFPKNNGTPKSCILIGSSIINHPFWGTTIFGNTHIYIYIYSIGHCQLTKCKSISCQFFFEGTLRAGLQLHDTHKDAGVEHGRVVHLERIFLLMGRFLQEVIQLGCFET